MNQTAVGSISPFTDSSLDTRQFAIHIENLGKRFGRVTAVRNASFSVRPGDVFGLLGPNGAGKTTIIRMVVGLMKADHGSVQVFGFDPIKQRREVLVRSSTILESPALYPRLSGYDNLVAMGYASGLHDRKKVEEVLTIVGMLERAKDRFETYSLGMKQRLCIAASLLTDPQLVILDEPTNGLDAAGMRDVRELIRDLGQQGHTVMLSSHLMNEVQQVCNRVAILQKGVVIAEGTVADLLSAQGVIRIRLQKEELENAQRVLTENGWSEKVSVVGDLLEVSAQAEQGRDLNRLLAGQGIYASEIVAEKRSLEEIYLELTGDTATLESKVQA
ncbi:MAG: ABC transporter ATP-binding protein [Anaerolineae bacterium]|nr:ABC transporter ATP-binding protein [Anaerolineae bacterium]